MAVMSHPTAPYKEGQEAYQSLCCSHTDKPSDQRILHLDPPVPMIPLRAQLSEDSDGATTGIGAGDEVDEELEAFKK